MKFELKTEKDNFSKSVLKFFSTFFFLTLIIILCDVALKLGIISRNHKIEYNCRLLSLKNLNLNLNATSQRIIIKVRMKTIPRKYEKDLEFFSFSVFNSSFII